jgi:hypothetical protein
MILPFFLTGLLDLNPKILFIGNSHTAFNNVPEMVQKLLASDSAKRKATIQFVSVSLLEDSGPNVEQAIRSTKWDAVVLQGAKVSSSHKYRYRQDRAISLANLALSGKAKVFLCAEWPRRGWDETEYQLGVYRDIQVSAKGATIIPICKIWDSARIKLGGIDLWLADGNHANLKGSFLSAVAIYRFLTENPAGNPSWRPNSVSLKEADIFHQSSLQIGNFAKAKR